MHDRLPPNTESHYRGKVAALARDRAHDDAELAQARADHRLAMLVKRSKQVAATAPPLTETQRDELAAIFAAALPRRAPAGDIR